MSGDIKRLYWFHLLNSMAVLAMANFLFLDKLFLRMDLNMSQFGIIKGLGLFIPMALNLLLAPLVMRLNVDRQIAGYGYLVRVILPFAFLGLPLVTRNPAALTFGFSVILVVTLIFPILANNSLAVLMKDHLPKNELGRHGSLLVAVWVVPYCVLTIPCSWYVEIHAHGSDSEFLWAMATVFAITAWLQIPASWLLLGMSPKPHRPSTRPMPGLRDLLEPFYDHRYRSLLMAIMVLGAVGATVGSFIYPYLLQGRGWNMIQVSLLASGAGLLGAMSMGQWGKLSDRIGGRNVLRMATPVMALGVFCLTGDSTVAVVIFGVLAWMGEAGVFGAAIVTGVRYLTLSMSKEDRSNIYLAAAAAVAGVGVLIGSICGGLLLDWLKASMNPDLPLAHYHIYFTYCALGYLIVGSWVLTMRDGRRRVTTTQMSLHVLRAIRSVIWRNR